MSICGGNRDLVLAVLHHTRGPLRWPAGLRGNAEMWIASDHLGPFAGLVRGSTGLYAAATLARGRLALRARLPGPPAPLPALLGDNRPSDLADAIPRTGVSGAVLVNLTHWLDVRRDLLIRRESHRALTDKINLGDVIQELRGDVVAWATAGDDATATVEIGLRGGHVVRKLLRECEDLDGAFPGLRASLEDRVCHIKVAGAAAMPIPFEARLRVDQQTLVANVTYSATPASAAGAPDAAARARTAQAASEVAAASQTLARIREGRDTVAVWGAGSLVQLFLHRRSFSQANGDSTVRAGVWAVAHVDEMGLAVRSDAAGIRAQLEVGTLWQDSDALLDQVEDLVSRMSAGDDVSGPWAHLVGTHPGSQLARERALGERGIALAVAGAAVTSVFLRSLYTTAIRGRANGPLVISSYRELVEAACACKDAACAREVAKRRAEWGRTTGHVVVNNDSVEELHGLARHYGRCMAPFLARGAGDGGGDGGGGEGTGDGDE